MQAKLDAADYTDLTKQQLVGDLLYSTILSYFALNNVQDRIAERQANSVGYRSPSYGLFKTSLTPRYWYGIPQSVKADGLDMDVDRFINQRVDRHNNTENWIAFNRAQGARMSAMEHMVPEQMFSTEEAPAQGISTVKAIQLAAAEGQKIYTITQANLNVALQQIDLPQEIENEIRDAVGAGMEVITHQSALGFSSSLTVGHILLDPSSGAGAYRIGNGENGGNMYSLFGSALAMVFGIYLVGLGPLGILLGVTLVYFAAMIFMVELIDFSSAGQVDWKIFALVQILGGMIAGFFAAAGVALASSTIDGLVLSLISLVMYALSEDYPKK